MSCFICQYLSPLQRCVTRTWLSCSILLWSRIPVELGLMVSHTILKLSSYREQWVSASWWVGLLVAFGNLSHSQYSQREHIIWTFSALQDKKKVNFKSLQVTLIFYILIADGGTFGTFATVNTHANMFFVFLPGGIIKEWRHIVSANCHFDRQPLPMSF